MNINDVSKKTGLSIATVSRAINNTGAVKTKTHNKVMDAIREMGYVPNALGRSLRSTETKTFYICVQSLDNPYYGAIVRAIEDEAIKYGYNILICESYSNIKRYKYFSDAIKSKKADGIILISPSSKDVIELFKGTPFVVCGETDSDFNCDTVNIDNEKAGFEAAKHLIDSGAANIAFFGGGNVSAKQRLTGFKRALIENNLRESDDLIFSNLYSYEDGENAINMLLQKNIGFDGLFAATDILAVASENALLKLGKKVSGDVKIVGFDDLIFAKMCAVPISTIRQPRGELGAAAFGILYEKVKNKESACEEKNKHVVLNHELVIRDSSR